MLREYGISRDPPHRFPSSLTPQPKPRYASSSREKDPIQLQVCIASRRCVVIHFAALGNPDTPGFSIRKWKGHSDMTRSSQIPYRPTRYNEAEMVKRVRDFYKYMNRRRSVRNFSPDPVPREMIELAVLAAATGPSGANAQPWHFVAVGSPSLKRQIRLAAETVEREFYEGARRDQQWLRDLEPLGTTWEKPFLETAPWLVAVFEERYGRSPDGSRITPYYSKESVSIACGIFITAIHYMGLATVPYTAAPMAFLSNILDRPDNERPLVLFPVGYPAPDATVPDQARKPKEAVLEWM